MSIQQCVLTGVARKMGKALRWRSPGIYLKLLTPAHLYFLVTHMLNFKHKIAPGDPTCWNSSFQVGKVGVNNGGEYQPRPLGEMRLELESLPAEFQNNRPPCLPESDSCPCLVMPQSGAWCWSRLCAVHVSSPSSPAPQISSDCSCRDHPTNSRRQRPLHLLFIPRRVSGQLAHTNWEAHYCFIKD